MHLLPRAVIVLTTLVVLPFFPSSRAAVILSPQFAVAPKVDAGEILVGELGCANCHSAPDSLKERLSSPHGPILGAGGQRITPQYLRKYLANPHEVKPGTAMPDLLHSLSKSEKTEAVDSLVHYLISLQPEEKTPGTSAEEYQLKHGNALYHSIGCVACHTPAEPPHNPAAPEASQGQALPPELAYHSIPLGDLALKTTVDQLARFLLDPLKTRPAGRMPAFNLTPTEAKSLAVYLLRAQLADPSREKKSAILSGLRYNYYEANFGGSVDLEKLTPTSSGTVPKFDISSRKREQSFGFRFSGAIRIPTSGSYTFYLSSDDGSRLMINGKMVVDNWGDHAPHEKSGTIHLAEGDHGLVVTFYNNGGGHELRVSWKGPGFENQEVPSTILTHIGQPMLPLAQENFILDSTKAGRGRELFTSLGCAACHSTDNNKLQPIASAKPFSDLDPDAPNGCLSARPASKAPRFDLSDSQRQALARTLKNRQALEEPLSPSQQVVHTMARLNCYACHTRDATGGPTDLRLAYFRVVGEVDMGDEGRIPPHLTAVGGKLKAEWIQEVLLNKGSVRPYMATRMPQFGPSAAGHLPKLFETADLSSSAKPAPETSPREAKFGRKLAGVGGLSCVSCHTFGPHKSLGIPAIDLTVIAHRLRYDWFHRYLLDPPSLRPGTRMPAFWPNGEAVNKEVLGGNTEAQIQALWAYLSLGKEADLPAGLVQGRMEIVAEKEPVIYRNFIAGAGTRAIGVGYPEKVNLAFDANSGRIAMLWQGSFIDGARHATGRGDGFEPPLGTNIRNFPDGIPFAILDNTDLPWPKTTAKEAGFRMIGYTFDQQRRPTFSYQFAALRIDDFFQPLPGEIDNYFRRTLSFRSGSSITNLYYRAAIGSQVESKDSHTFMIDGNLTLKFSGSAAAEPIIRQAGDKKELLVPIKFDRNKETTDLVEEIIW